MSKRIAWMSRDGAVAGLGQSKRRWWILAAMSGVLGLIVLDETVVGVALATIRRDLTMSEVDSHWVVNAYLLSFTCLVAVGGRLGDVLGHRSYFVAGVGVFALASLGAGLAPHGGWLIAARALQGLGAAIIFPSSWAMLTRAFPPGQRGLAFGIQTTVAGMFMASGPLIGGALAELISWRWIFWINLPVLAAIALIVLAAWPRALDEKGTAPARALASFDGPGLLTLVAGLIALVTALMEGGRWGWSAPATMALTAAGVALLVVFTALELRRQEPLIRLQLLRNRTFTGGVVAFFVFQFDKVAVFIFVPLYLQQVLDRSPIDAGFPLVIAVLPTLLTSLVAGRLTDRFGSRGPLMVGLVLNGLALLLVASSTHAESYAMIVIPLIVWGASLPLISVCPRRALMSAVPKTAQGQASGINLTIQMLGGTIGMALCGALVAATNDFGLAFILTGTLVLATVPLAWFTIER